MIRRKTTKELLGESIHELAAAKAVDKITIKEVVENCGLSSATFYRHFQDKLELIAWIFNYQMEYIFMDFCEGAETWRQAVFDMVSILANDQSFYKNALKHTDGPNSFFFSTHSRCRELLMEYIRQSCGEDYTDEMEFDVLFYMRGSSYSITDWFLNDSTFTVDQITDFICRAMPECLKPYLK